MAKKDLNTIRGTIYDTYNIPLSNAAVHAFDQDLRSTQLLGKTKTDGNGKYTIRYDLQKYAHSEHHTAHLFIRVLNSDKVLAESPVYYNVSGKFVLDFKIDNTPLRELNEFDRLVQKIKPVIDPQRVSFSDLRESDKFKDISFLSNEVGEEAWKIALLPTAFTLAKKTKIAPDIFYGLFRLRYPTELNALLLIKSESIAAGISRAINENIISSKWRTDMDVILSSLNQLATGILLSDAHEGSKDFKKIIGTVLTRPKLQETFVSVYFANEKTPEKFWEALGAENGFNSNVITGIQSALKINLLTNNQPALTALLYKEQEQNPALKDTRGFASFTKEDWSSRITRLVASGELEKFPEGIEGDTPEKKTENYANALDKLVNLLHPTDVFANQLSKDTSDAFKETKSDLKTFLGNNIDFDLKNNRVHTLFEESNLSGITDKARLKKELLTINRLSKITNAFGEVSALHLAGITSATTLVNKYSPSAFAESFSSSMTREKAEVIYKNAQQIDRRSTAIALGVKMRNDVPVYVINGPSNERSPDYISMFGDMNCDCEHCQSVYSPSAYFVDVLHTLKQYSPEAFSEITTRRPDLIQILLTCKNTNTPLPYIDLVNELLEDTISPPPPLQFHQTTNATEELLAYPEHVNMVAYDQLKTATSAFNLPLNLPLEETRLYLEKLGVSRHELMELFFSNPNDSYHNDVFIAAEYLQLSIVDLKIVNGETQLPVTLDKVTDFLRDTGLSYVDMLQLLECNFINPGRGIKIVSTTDDEASCRIEDLKIQSPAPQNLHIMPFIRLWKKTGWNMFDLDRAFTALGVNNLSGDINKKLIVPLSHIARLKSTYRISILDSIVLWSDIDIATYFNHAIEGQPKIPSQYEILFQNKRVNNPADPDFNNPGNLAGTLEAKAGIVTAALNLSQRDFDTLRQAPFVDGNLTLPNLSVLFRYGMLAKVMRIPVNDLIVAIDLTGISPFVNASQSSDTLKFLDKISSIRSIGFSLAELNVLLKGTPASQQVDVNSTSKVLTTLREGLNKIELLEPVGVTPQERADNKLQNQSNFVVETLATEFKAESKFINIVINRLVKSVSDNTKPALTAFLDADFIASKEPLFTVSSTGAITWKFPGTVTSYLLISETWKRISKIISKFKISVDEFIYFQKNEAAFKLDGLWNVPNSTTNIFPAFENLYHIISFRNVLTAPPATWFTLFDAIDNAVDAKKDFIQTLSDLSNRTVLAIEHLLGDSANVSSKGILQYTFPADYLKGDLLLAVIQCLNKAVLLGTSVDNISKLIISEPNGGQEAEGAAISKNLLKAKYDVATWLRVIEPVSNHLRVKKRDALVSYILTSPEPVVATFRQDHAIASTNDLYAHFLIDIEMDACMITSRIKQAISSVQLFVDRCLMNLEGNIVWSSELTLQWNTWRKQYRVWEANRKIFLYPENWIEPELRDDKSPFFKELESKLRQNEITDETAEDAVRTYLEKLEAVSNLQTVSVFPDRTLGVVHVIGRTQAIPHQYYYTKQAKGVWSAWEKIDLDIEGDHILCVVWNNRLMLFWGMFTEKEDDSEGFTVPGAGEVIPPTPKNMDFKLAWSEHKHGKWISKKLSKEAINFSSFLRLNLKLISLSSFIDKEKLYIRPFFDLNVNIPDDFTWNASYQTFVFDGCHSAPVISPVVSTEDGLKLKIIQRIHQTELDGMFIKEVKDDFSVLDNGVFKDAFAGNMSETLLFRNTPGKYQVLPEYHEIEKLKSSTFFYRNERNNFFVQSRQRFNHDLFENVSVLTEGVLLERRSLTPFSASTLNFNATASMPMTRVSSVNFSSVHGDVSELVLTDFVNVPPLFLGKQYAFQSFYYPYVCELIKTLNSSGIDGVYRSFVDDTDGIVKVGIQNRKPQPIFIPQGAYNPTNAVKNPYPLEQVDFDHQGVYSIYNWELFFHIPLLMATKLSKNQKFDEARRWFHYIFDPTNPSSSTETGVERFWITHPFKNEIKNGILPIQELLNTASPDLDLQLSSWERNPFNPHAVARLRISSYMRETVMKYIDNLIDWGDQLFQRDTIESINEATLLYILAANMLGKKPDRVPARAIPEENSFLTIQDKLDRFSNAKVEIQSFFSLSESGSSENADTSVLMPQFCIPKNDLLLGYWDRVADRLFKIRHCLNIEGVFRQLPLFEPPIDPGLLVKATAAGLDLNAVLNDMNTSLPSYRFMVMLQKANDLCNDVKTLGSELLVALEKRDAEQLSLLRSTHELNMLSAVRDIKRAEVDEAKQNLGARQNERAVVQAKRDFYSERSKTSKNDKEQQQLDSLGLASVFQDIQSSNEIVASVLFGMPDVTIGAWSWGTTTGGKHFSGISKSISASFGAMADHVIARGNIAGIEADYIRRQEDWKFQERSADLELKQMDKQIAAAEIRLALTEKELDNHDLQSEQSREVDDFLKGKFSNEELYEYMVGQISSVYFQSYQLAFDTARKAQKCFAYELGVDNPSFIQFGYWDSLKKGLLSGEKLQYDLRRLENAYLDQNKREYEVTKHISITMLDPLALVSLRSTGMCEFQIPEVLYDMDHPGQYFRRIKSVSVSLPCVAGPFTSVSAKLSLMNNRYRKNANLDNVATTGYTESPADDERFNYNTGTLQSIATSHGQNDSGIFELDFRDERYLPFEGAGAISGWKLELPSEIKQFDYNTIADVMIHVKYTAKEGGNQLKAKVNLSLKERLNAITQQLSQTGLHIAINLKHDLSAEWHLLKKNGTVDLKIDRSRLPYMAQSLNVDIEQVMFLVKAKGNPTTIPLTIDSTTTDLSKINEWEIYSGINSNIELDSIFALSLSQTDVNNLETLIAVVKYTF
jgi:hypothetical protein